MSDIIITMQHVRLARLDGRTGVNCATGIRGWARRHGIDLHEFSRNGMPLQVAEQIDDAFARRVVELAKAEAGAEAADA